MPTKSTLWTELDAGRAEILMDRTYSIKIRHPLLKRPRYFQQSKKGNWYSRYTGKEIDECAEGFIIKGELRRNETSPGNR